MTSDDFITRLAQGTESKLLPDYKQAKELLLNILGVMFPHFGKCSIRSKADIKNELDLLKVQLTTILTPLQQHLEQEPHELSTAFFDKLPQIYDLLLLDAEAMLQGDPAATSIDEVILAYPGFLAVAIHRIAHALHTLKIPTLPRMLSEYAHQRTGVDIHPGAEIAESFCIDHATGVVIGETTVIGKNVKLYQGVTLGALSVTKQLAQQKRHPTIEDNVVIYANATILGGNTVIGANTVIGGNVWLTGSVPPNSSVYHKSDVKVRTEKGE
jgi:serine O-acetyltransferase